LNTQTPDSLPVQTKVNEKSRPNLRLVTLYSLSIAALCCASYLWFKLSSIEEQLAKQSAQSNTQSLEAKVSSKEAQDLARETAAKLALLDAKVMEVALQRSQLEDLMKSLSHTRDENLVAELESMLVLGQQQAQLMGSAQPLISALKTAEQRISKASQPKLLSIDRALLKDLDRIKSNPVLDTPALLLKLDQLIQKVEGLALLNDPQSPLSMGPQEAKTITQQGSTLSNTSNTSNASNSTTSSAAQPTGWAESIRASSAESWLDTLATHIWGQIKGLVRITKIDQPEASLLAPSQGYFLRENLKLRLLNSKLGLLAHQINSFKSDLNESQRDLDKYFAMQSKQGQEVAALLKEIKELGAQPDTPQIQDTWAAINASRLGN